MYVKNKIKILLTFSFALFLYVPKAQMKSCCEPNNIKVVSTIKQSKGTLLMAKILDSISRNANPMDYYLMNTARAEMHKKNFLTSNNNQEKLNLLFKYATELLNAGKTEEAIKNYKLIIGYTQSSLKKITSANKIIFEQLAISYMRKGETENCAQNHSAQSCIVPIQGKGIHKLTSGSSQAIEIYKAILTAFPEDLQARYLLNIAYMTLGKYPQEVPLQWLINDDIFKNQKSNVILKDVATEKGIDMNGLSGGCVIEDFDNDGLLDIMASSYGLSDQIRYLHQQKNGTFKNKTASSGLVGITGGLNLIHTDYNNDGFADIIVLRGGWLGLNAKFPFSLLKNNGNNTFDDVTVELGLYSAAPTQTAACADFDNDGWVDLFVPHENYPCQLFKNNNGKFIDIAPSIGLNITSFAKGVTAGDINNDGYADLYLSILGEPNKLWLNITSTTNTNITFSEIAAAAGVNEPIFSFPTWFFDYDNDGWLDLFVGGYDLARMRLAGEDAAREMLNLPAISETARLYHNNGNNTFTNVSNTHNINHVNYTMGCNYGDVDNDGWLDFYLGTGAPEFTSIVPNKLYKNIEGKKFEDITFATNTGHIQKGHAVAFGDIDNDGDQDIYEVIGGAFEGDHFKNIFFENSTINNNKWLKIKLEGTSSNRQGIGARVIIKTKKPDGSLQNFYHTVSSGGSFGAKPFLIEAGLGEASYIEEVEIKWPNQKHTIQIIKGVKLNTFIKIKEAITP
jgi:tetratricopeptide (TPR) repeat protein